jgi:hypothetical protein
MNNPYLTVEEIRDTFINTKLEENYNFLEEDLMKLATAFGKLRNEEMVEAVFRAVRLERSRCVEFVRSLNPEVARALEDKKWPL